MRHLALANQNVQKLGADVDEQQKEADTAAKDKATLNKPEVKETATGLLYCEQLRGPNNVDGKFVVAGSGVYRSLY